MTEALPHPQYPHLFRPLTVGSVTLRNRIVQSAHSKLFLRDGGDSRRDLAYHVERARGGVGLIVTGMRPVHPTSVPSYGRPHYPLGYLRRAIAGDRRMTAAVQEHGAAIFAQIGHFGNATSHDYGDDLRVLWGPSPIASPTFGDQPKEMELADIAETIEWWGRAAECVREGGFDGVELHLAHGYLVHQFLSPLYNHRADAYGGSLENRMRLAREVAQAVRARVGADFVVGARLGMSDFVAGGHTVEDAAAVARALADDGSVDYVSASTAGLDKSLEAAPSDLEDGWLLESAARMKALGPSLPMIAVGGLRDPAQVEAVLASGHADLVAMTRALIADPELPNKVRDGAQDTVHRCVRGNQGCIGRAFRGLPMGCTINPAAGRESVLSPRTRQPADPPAAWLVVGGGPGGMRAAEELAARGHRVTLLEREAELGGQVRRVARLPGRGSYAMLVEDAQRRLERAAVDLRLGREVSAAEVIALAADQAAAGVILATGSLPDTSGRSVALPAQLSLPGLDSAHVMTTWDVVDDLAPAGSRVVILDDEGWRPAAGLAELLLDTGRRVTLVTRFNSLLPGTATTHEMPILYRRLLGKGLAYQLNAWPSRVDGRSVVVTDLVTGQQSTLEADTIALATAPHPDDALYRALVGKVTGLRRIGDCVAPRRIDHAIYEGVLAGRELWTTAERTIDEALLEDWATEPGTETLASAG